MTETTTPPEPGPAAGSEAGLRWLDASFVPVRSTATYTVEMDGEAVVLDEAADRLHLLNSTAALVWACFDGLSPLEEICVDLAEGLGTPYEVILADTIAITRQLAAEGLLEPTTGAGAEAGTADPVTAGGGGRDGGGPDGARLVDEPPDL